jgi:hypothetical protein
MHKFVLLVIALTVLIVAVPIAAVFADVSVGLKKGDWIEYQVNTSGNPPEDHTVKWARMEVTDVQDVVISLDIQSQFLNGTIFPEHITLNLATGLLGDYFVIPKNLNVGDRFYDSSQGNITITSMEQRTTAGAQRTVISAATNVTTFYWDKETGILVAATSNMSTYTMITDTNGTNIWQPHTLGLEQTVFYALVVAVVVVLAIIVAVFVLAQKKELKKLIFCCLFSALVCPFIGVKW